MVEYTSIDCAIAKAEHRERKGEETPTRDVKKAETIEIDRIKHNMNVEVSRISLHWTQLTAE